MAFFAACLGAGEAVADTSVSAVGAHSAPSVTSTSEGASGPPAQPTTVKANATTTTGRKWRKRGSLFDGRRGRPDPPSARNRRREKHATRSVMTVSTVFVTVTRTPGSFGQRDELVLVARHER